MSIQNQATVPTTFGTARHLIAVVGFDGSEPSLRALRSASDLISGRLGSLVVVFVAHPSTSAAMSPYAQSEARLALDGEALESLADARALLGDEGRWRFERRDGSIAEQLMAVARETADSYGSDTSVVVVVGKAAKSIHHLAGSVPVSLVRHEQFPVLVVP
jgi:nucleotide-binding universal stress UspA family protein